MRFYFFIVELLEFFIKKYNKKMKEIIIKKSNLSNKECFWIQVKGLKFCETCKFKDSSECGGKEIRKTLMNLKRFKVPLNKNFKMNY